MPPASKQLDILSLQEGFLNDLEGIDATAAVIDLVRFLEDPDWADMALRPRQRLMAKVSHNAIGSCSREHDFNTLIWEKIRLDTRKWWILYVEENGHPPDLSTMSHCVFPAADGSWWYDEELDYKYMTGRENKYANMIVRVDPISTEPLVFIYIIGRGGTKTTLAAGFGSWMAYRLHSKDDPHRYYALEAKKPLKIQNVATSEEQAKEFFNAFKTNVTSIKWFQGRYEDLEKSIDFGALPGSGRTKVPRITAGLASSNSKSGRGGDTIAYIHDEVAFAERGGDGMSGHRSDRALYRAYHSAVKTRARGKGVVFLLSSPAEADGLFYELYRKAEEGQLTNVVVFQVSTWEMIPGHTRADYQQAYDDDPDGAEMEFGAQFHTGSSNLIHNAWTKLETAVENGKKLGLIKRRNTYWEDERLKKDGRYNRAIAPRYDYAAHLDTSKGGDRLYFAISHMEGPFTVIDYWRGWDKLPHYTKELEPFLIQMNAAYGGFRQLSFDQYASLQLIQDLTDAGINCIEKTFTADYNDDIARNLMSILSDAGVTMALYPHPYKREKEMPRRGSPLWDGPEECGISAYVAWREVEAVKKIVKVKANSGGKRYLISAEAPTTGVVVHDDAVDALMVVAFEARMFAMGSGHFSMLDSTMGARPSRAEELSILVSEGQSLESMGMPSRCSFCYHAWTDLTGDTFVLCPSCGQATQIRQG